MTMIKQCDITQPPLSAAELAQMYVYICGRATPAEAGATAAIGRYPIAGLFN